MTPDSFRLEDSVPKVKRSVRSVRPKAKELVVGRVVRATISGVAKAMPGVTVARGVEFVRVASRKRRTPKSDAAVSASGL